MARTSTSTSGSINRHSPSSPHKPPIGNLFVKNEQRLASVNFCTLSALRSAADAIIGDRAWQYAGSKRITLSGTSAILESDIDIDDIMEADPASDFDFIAQCPAEYTGMAAIVAGRAKRELPTPSPDLTAEVADRGESDRPRSTPGSRRNPAPPKPPSPKLDLAVRIPLSELLATLNLDGKHARSNLRDAKEIKPTELGWHFARNNAEIARITAIITKPR